MKHAFLPTSTQGPDRRGHSVGQHYFENSRFDGRPAAAVRDLARGRHPCLRLHRVCDLEMGAGDPLYDRAVRIPQNVDFIIPHLVFKEPATVQEMITQALRFELLEWGVWPGQFGPTFYLNPRGEREGRKTLARPDPPGKAHRNRGADGPVLQPGRDVLAGLRRHDADYGYRRLGLPLYGLPLRRTRPRKPAERGRRHQDQTPDDGRHRESRKVPPNSPASSLKNAA